MSVALILLLFACMIGTLFSWMHQRKWKLLRTVHGQESYYAIIGKLKNKGILYKTKIPVHFGGRGFNDTTQYDIYIKKEEEHAAVEALHEHLT
ncbi:hypothetical protein P4T04_11250 [Bacillus badius]|uniref:hypothetical protein n=1 Tax=Bacillus badius TaxID=1455 RepID=UPI002E22CD5E|nr:hypothetical protein [Bacillus badius]